MSALPPTDEEIRRMVREVEERVSEQHGVRIDDLERREKAVFSAYRLLRAMLTDSNHAATAALLDEQWRGFAIELKVKL